MSILKVDTLQHRDGTEYILSERNKLINGDFSVAQRGVSLTSTNSANNDASYTLDRWQLFSDGNDVVDVSKETSTVPTNQLYAIALDVETANKKFGIAQKIEQKNCVDLIGQEVTLSFKAKVSATTNLDNVKCAIIAWDGTADTLTDDMISAWGSEGTNPTLATNYTYENTPANLNLTTSYTTYTTTATIDTANAKNVVVFIWSDVTTTSTGEFLYITDVQLEKSPSASTFERKNFGRQLADCRRYYVRLDRTGPPAEPYVQAVYVGHGQLFSATEAVIYPIMYEPMRDTPDIGVSATNDFTIELTGGHSRDTSALAIYNDASHTDETFSYNPMIQITISSSSTADKYGRFFINDATNGFLELDAEL